MHAEPRILSNEFLRLYGDAGVFENFSKLHPICFHRVLPFQAADAVIDDIRLLAAEAAHLAEPNAATRLAVLEAFRQCGLLSAEEMLHMRSALEDLGADFFEFMGEAYANANLFICALRWYLEWIEVLETQTPNARSDTEDVYASVGYCLYSLGLFNEAITWTKSCVGPGLLADLVGAALTDFQAQLAGGRLLATERAGGRTRYVASTQASEFTNECTPRLKSALNDLIPFQESYLSWLAADAPVPAMPSEGYPFRVVLSSNPLLRHKMNLLFALAAQATDLAGAGRIAESERLWQEIAMLEPQAERVLRGTTG
jgi:hypothetical protein